MIRDEFSRKVFIPLTRLRRDVRHYCIFATTPALPRLVDDWVVDGSDAESETEMRSVCADVVFTDTLMNSPLRSKEVARTAIGLLSRLRNAP